MLCTAEAQACRSLCMHCSHEAVVMTAGYANNSDFLNHCIIGFLKRICNPKGLNLEPMLYQVHGSRYCVNMQPKAMCCALQVAQRDDTN